MDSDMRVENILEEGILQSEGLYARGMRNGRWRLFGERGGLQQSGSYHDDEKDGVWTLLTER